MAETTAKKLTIGEVLLTCHTTCGRIEELLDAVTSGPPQESRPGKLEAEKEPQPAATLTVLLDADLRSLRNLDSRLHQIEVHAESVRRELSEVA